jgi:hypothetical protein
VVTGVELEIMHFMELILQVQHWWNVPHHQTNSFIVTSKTVCRRAMTQGHCWSMFASYLTQVTTKIR